MFTFKVRVAICIIIIHSPVYLLIAFSKTKLCFRKIPISAIIYQNRNNYGAYSLQTYFPFK